MSTMNFKELANQAVAEKAISPIIAGRVSMSTDDLIATYPDGVSINNFDYVADWEHYVYTIKEAPDKFLSAGSALESIFKKFVEMYDGSVEDAADDFSKSGGIRVKLNKTKSTRTGKTFTNVTVL